MPAKYKVLLDVVYDFIKKQVESDPSLNEKKVRQLYKDIALKNKKFFPAYQTTIELLEKLHSSLFKVSGDKAS